MFNNRNLVPTLKLSKTHLKNVGDYCKNKIKNKLLEKHKSDLKSRSPIKNMNKLLKDSIENYVDINSNTDRNHLITKSFLEKIDIKQHLKLLPKPKELNIKTTNFHITESNISTINTSTTSMLSK